MQYMCKTEQNSAFLYLNHMLYTRMYCSMLILYDMCHMHMCGYMGANTHVL